MIMLNAPLVGNRLGYPDLSGSTCSSCSPSSIRPASRCRRRRASPTRSGSSRRRRSSGGALPARGGGRLLATLDDRTGPSATAPGPGATLHRLRWPWAPPSPSGWSGPSATSAGCSPASPNGRKPPAAPQPRPVRSISPTRGPARRAGRRGAEAAPGPARLCRRGRRRLRAARRRTSPICCSPRPAPGSARRSAISPPPRSGPSRPTARSGSRPTPRRCSANWTARGRALPRRRRAPRRRSSSARAARIISAC